MRQNYSNVSSGGIGFIGTLQITFIVLKLVGVIDWKWAAVLLPSIIVGALIAIFSIFLIVVYTSGEY